MPEVEIPLALTVVPMIGNGKALYAGLRVVALFEDPEFAHLAPVCRDLLNDRREGPTPAKRLSELTDRLESLVACSETSQSLRGLRSTLRAIVAHLRSEERGDANA